MHMHVHAVATSNGSHDCAICVGRHVASTGKLSAEVKPMVVGCVNYVCVVYPVSVGTTGEKGCACTEIMSACRARQPQEPLCQ